MASKAHTHAKGTRRCCCEARVRGGMPHFELPLCWFRFIPSTLSLTSSIELFYLLYDPSPSPSFSPSLSRGCSTHTRVQPRASEQHGRNTGRGGRGGRGLVRVRVGALALSLLRQLIPAAAELKGLHDEPCHYQEHLDGQRQRSRRLWRGRARAREDARTRGREDARTRARSGWAPSGPASPLDCRAGRSRQARPAKDGRSTLLAHSQQCPPHERAGPLGPLLVEHLPDRVAAAREVELV